MFVLILFIAALLMAAAAASAWQALQLIPTDLGLAWMQGAFIAGSAGLVVLAVALAARQVAVARSVIAALPASSVEAESTMAAPAMREAEPPARGRGAAIAGAGAAFGMAAGAALAAGKAEPEAEAPPPALRAGADSRLLDDFEKDLFAVLPASPKGQDLPAAGAPPSADGETSPEATAPADAGSTPPAEAGGLTASPTTAGQAPEPGAEAAPLPAFPELPADLTPEQAPVVAAPLEDPFFAERVRAAEAHFAETLTLPPPAAELVTEPPDTAAAAPETMPAADAPMPEADAAPPAAAQESPAGEPVLAAAAPERATISGLIHDADLEALENDAPPLAPIGELEEVGSYESGGTRFTMYSDGSVNTIGPEGVRRFRTLDELRAHLDQRGR